VKPERVENHIALTSGKLTQNELEKMWAAGTLQALRGQGRRKIAREMYITVMAMRD
jgi:hypothetical protein